MEPPRCRGKLSGARESQLFFGCITTKMFSKIHLDIATTTEQHYIIRIAVILQKKKKNTHILAHPHVCVFYTTHIASLHSTTLGSAQTECAFLRQQNVSQYRPVQHIDNDHTCTSILKYLARTRPALFFKPVASARRSGQEDFQRGTPPVSLASCSISPFLRACISVRNVCY